MSKILKKFSVLTSIFILLFFIEQILGINYYRINDDGYPISVLPIHGSNSKMTFKRSTQPHYPIQNEENNEMNKTKVIEKKVEASKKGRVCLRCPQLITAVANEGLDGILLASPKVRSCKTNLPYSSKLYQIETLFGQEMSIVLPQGRHKLQANIRNIETGLIVHSCILKYNVIVRRCKGYPNVKNKNLTLSCTAGTLWGSECVFSCKNKDEYLSHHEPMFCNENAEWVGKEPTCGPELDEDVFYLPEDVQDEPKIDGKSDEFCKEPNPPVNGQYECDAKKIDLQDIVRKLKANSNASFKTLGPGTICKVECNHSYSIPFHLQPLSLIECANGSWNTTDIEVCYKKQPQRRHIKRHQKN